MNIKCGVLFNSDFISAKTVTKQEVQEEVNKLKAEGEASEEFTPEDKQEIARQCMKLECLIAAVEYLRENNESSKGVAIAKGEIRDQNL